MDLFSGYTKTEILKKINDIQQSHSSIKDEIVKHTDEIDEIEEILKPYKDKIIELENIINDKLTNLRKLEENYVILIDVYNNKK